MGDSFIAGRVSPQGDTMSKETLGPLLGISSTGFKEVGCNAESGEDTRARPKQWQKQ